ncbi:nitrite reductase small subunit NirD [Sulfurivermis fontis]|uniref:nitrite reductase small subunit NirD n=1 Tax=Sulfurivermis fontis TaxID=1972068 RepID=UPI000FDC8DA3|nr:nitrite reductase small subunit NirD [Sulfurivermis fontis]
MSNWITIGTLEDIPRRGARVVQTTAGEIAVFRAASDAVLALANRCPHKGGPLAEGIVFDHYVACPLHNWKISLESGEAAAPDKGCARRYAVRVEDGRVLLDLNGAGQVNAA